MKELKSVQILKALLKSESVCTFPITYTDGQCVSVNGISVKDALQELEQEMKDYQETVDFCWRCWICQRENNGR